MTSADETQAKIELLRSIAAQVEFCAGKQDAMERRQCDSEARGTDAARMADLWTRGEHANISDQTVWSLRASIVARDSYIGTSYASIFRDKALCSIMVAFCRHKPL